MRDETANSAAILREAVVAFREKFPNNTVGEVLTRALIKHIGLSKESAEVLGARLDHIVATGKNMNGSDKVTIKKALIEVYERVTIDYSYDIPTLALYAKKDAKKIYIDQGFKKEWTLEDGRKVNLVPHLTLHEVVEKCLIDEAQFSLRPYFKCHQIAQRIEQAAVRADDISWKEYQYRIMIPEIDRAYTHRAYKLPPDVDSTAYQDLGEMELLGPVTHTFFTVSKITHTIYHVFFESGARMAATMMRFQEFYESPKYRGKYFTREEFLEWYSLEKNGATYMQNWSEEGFNIPSSVFKPFNNKKFDPLTEDEEAFLGYFKNKAGDFYIIATAPESGKAKLDHEIAHALYYLNVEYHTKVDDILATIDETPIRTFLTTNPDYASYHNAVLHDEVHAYLAHSSDELEAHGIDLAPYKETIEKLKKIYAAYEPRG
jgi:hypothetical protein